MSDTNLDQPRAPCSRDELEERLDQRSSILRATVWELSQEIVRRSAAEHALCEEKDRLQRIVETLPHGIVELDTQWRVVFANSAWHRLHGYPPGSLIGRYVWDVWTPDEARRKGLAVAERLLRERAEPSRQRFRLQNRDGKWIDICVDWNYVRAAGGEVAGIVAAVTDITAQGRAEEQAQRRLNELTNVSRFATMAAMVGGIAHELNQPLATVANYAYACRHYTREVAGAAVEPLQDALEQIGEQVARAGEIIRKLRDCARKADTRRRLSDLGELATEVIRSLEVETRFREVALSIEVDEGLPLVEVDRLQIEQAIENLVRNAIESVSQEPPERRHVLLRISADEGNFVRLGVLDWGPGVAEPVAARIFEPFFSTKPNSLGVGLSIARSIVESHGGQIEAAMRGGADLPSREWAANDPSAVVWFRLPAAAAKSPARTSSHRKS